MDSKIDIEREYLGFLIDKEPGRWLLRNLINQSGALQSIRSEGGTKDAYIKGQQDMILINVVNKIVKHYGYGALDKILGKGI